MTETHASLTGQEWVTTEGMATWMTRFRDPSGFECQLMLESETGKDVLSKAQGAIAYLQEAGCTPVSPGWRAGLDQSKSPKQDAPVEVKQDPNEPVVMCSIHGVPLKRWSKNGRSWYSHKLPDGRWCRGV
jgi:hypothetical protein